MKGFFFILWTLFVTIQMAETIFPKDEKSDAHYLPLKLRECFLNDSEPIVFIGNLTNKFLKTVQTAPEPTSVGIINYKSKYTISEKEHKKNMHTVFDYEKYLKPFPMYKMVLADIEVSSLNATLMNMENSVWWDRYGHFIIRITHSINGCTEVFDYLKIMWDFGILNVVLACQNQYFTYNPFTRHAPPDWKIIQIAQQANKHPFFIFRLLNKSTTYSCGSLFFEKSTNLGGYPVNVLVISEVDLPANQKHSQAPGHQANAADLIWKKLAASVNTIIPPDIDDFGFIEANGSSWGAMKEILGGKYDYFLNFHTDQRQWKNQFYIYKQTKMCFLTQKVQESLNKRFRSTLGLYALILLLGLYLFAILVFTLLHKESLSQAFLSVTGVLLGIPIAYEPHSISTRMIFLTLLILCMSINSALEGKFYSVVVGLDYKPFIESEQELIDSGYELFNVFYMDKYLHYTSMRGKTQLAKNLSTCIANVENNPETACISFCYQFEHEDFDYKGMHVSEFKDFGTDYFVVIHRDRFSLRRILRRSIGWIQEAGLILYAERNFTATHRPQNAVNNESTDLTLKQLSIAFFILIYGAASSTLIFLLEIFFRLAPRLYYRYFFIRNMKMSPFLIQYARKKVRIHARRTQ